MLIPNHFVIPESLAVTSLEFTGKCVIVHAKMMDTTARCPSCNTPSPRIHSRYARTLADLPRAGLPVSFQGVVRRFRYPKPDCSQHIFAERLGEAASVYARRSTNSSAARLLVSYI